MSSTPPPDAPWGGPTDPRDADTGTPTHGQPSYGADPTSAAGSQPGWGQDGAWGQPPTDPATGYGQAGYGYQQPGYGQPTAYGYQQPYGYAKAEHPQGTTILVLGICSLVFGFSCGIGFLMGPVAWIMGNGAIKEIDADPNRYGNRGSVQAGRICGIVSSVLLGLGVLLVIAVFALGSSGSDV